MATTTTAPRQLATLPAELIQNISRFLIYRPDLLHLGQTCRHVWESVLEILYATFEVDLRENSLGPASVQWQPNTSAEASLSASNPGIQHVHYVKLYCDYQGTRSPDTEIWLRKLFRMLPKGRLLGFEYFPCIERDSVLSPGLDFEKLSTDLLAELYASQPMLQHRMVGVGLVPKEEQTLLARSSSVHLTALTIICNAPSTVDAAASILSKTTHLRTLELICAPSYRRFSQDEEADLGETRWTKKTVFWPNDMMIQRVLEPTLAKTRLAKAEALRLNEATPSRPLKLRNLNLRNFKVFELNDTGYHQLLEVMDISSLQCLILDRCSGSRVLLEEMHNQSLLPINLRYLATDHSAYELYKSVPLIEAAAAAQAGQPSRIAVMAANIDRGMSRHLKLCSIISKARYLRFPVTIPSLANLDAMDGFPETKSDLEQLYIACSSFSFVNDPDPHVVARPNWQSSRQTLSDFLTILSPYTGLRTLCFDILISLDPNPSDDPNLSTASLRNRWVSRTRHCADEILTRLPSLTVLAIGRREPSSFQGFQEQLPQQYYIANNDKNADGTVTRRAVQVEMRRARQFEPRSEVLESVYEEELRLGGVEQGRRNHHVRFQTPLRFGYEV